MTSFTTSSAKSKKDKFDSCLEITKVRHYEGRKRLVKVALKYTHLGTLPVTFEPRFQERDIDNIITILKQTREIKFSDRKEVAELVRQAYSKLDWD